MRLIPQYCLIVLLSFSSPAQTHTFSGAYYCVAEFAGGLSFDESRKTWESARLHHDSKVVLRLRYEGTVKQKDALSETLWENYTVTLETAGEKHAALCTSDFDYPSKTVLVGSYGYVSCTANLTLYRFNLRNNRFLAAYLQGFVNGADNNDNSPNVAGGRCTKID
jgi:hypothetical protein